MIQALRRGLEILDALAAGGAPIRCKTLADRLGVDVSTAHRLLGTLGHLGYVTKDPRSKMYSLGVKSVGLARAYLGGLDARALALYLVMMHERLQPLRPDDPEIVSLRIACQDRVRLVEEHTAKLNELRSILKVHYPPVLKLFGNLESKITLQFLLKYPTQDQMLHLTERRLRGWLERKHYTAPQRIPEMVELLRRPALPVSEHLQKAKAPRIGYLAKSLLALQAEIAKRKKQITKDFKQLP